LIVTIVTTAQLRARDYQNTRERLYCFDGFAVGDPKYRIKIRVTCSAAVFQTYESGVTAEVRATGPV
jgi:hypothetical protein